MKIKTITALFKITKVVKSTELLHMSCRHKINDSSFRAQSVKSL